MSNSEISKYRVLSQTESLCPVCLKKIPAFRVTDGCDVFFEKQCEVHGKFSVVIWRNNPPFKTWMRPKIPVQPPVCYAAISKGCPFDCGLCVSHRQITCTALIEITQRCNLSCKYCFASSEKSSVSDPDIQTIEFLFSRVKEAAPSCNIQLSGGEPTLRDDLPEIIEMGRRKGFGFIQLNTNGLRLAEQKDYAKRLKEAGLASVFLQFDGISDEVYASLRGRKLLAEKILAIDRCAKAGIGVVLVPMIVPGVNTHEIGSILKFALKQYPAVRGIHFQPVSYFGRYPKKVENHDRITIPEILSALEFQSDGMVKASDFKPPGCENALCSFNGKFLVMNSEQLKPVVTDNSVCCNKPLRADIGARQSITSVARQWSGVEGQGSGFRVQGSGIEGLGSGIREKRPVRVGQGRVEEMCDLDIDGFLEFVRTRSFSISGMAFQDVWNLDLERLKDCCIHVVSNDGRLIPFCAYNLTDIQNKPIYRGI
ncbi:MAG: radical SAM protein [Proteobacteria bacterium]|nr:radical SAM protein [Pseudomonadota bacterium]